MESQKSFGYEPLTSKDEIRLLRIHPDYPSDQIRCSISHFRLKQVPRYQALSYAWGSVESERHLITLNGQEIHIRENLWKALFQLRRSGFVTGSPSGNNWIWIDALSINQLNVSERNHQVKLMRSIYRYATVVYAFIYHDLECSDYDRAIWFLQQLNIAGTYTGEVYNHHNVDMYPYISNDGIDYDTWMKLSSILTLPYWSRMWIVQEIILASNVKVFCGKHTFRWDSISRFRKLLKQIDAMPLEDRHAPVLWRKDIREVRERIQRSHAIGLDSFRADLWYTSLVDYVRICVYSLSSDPRDKIYGLLGVASDCQNGELAVDYGKSVFELFKDVMTFYRTQRRPVGGYRNINVGKLIQRALGSPALMDVGAREYLQSPRFLSTPPLRFAGIITGIVSSLGRLWKSAELPQYTQGSSKYARDLNQPIVDLMRKLVPLNGRLSFASRAVPPTITKQDWEHIFRSQNFTAPTLITAQKGPTHFTTSNARVGLAPTNTTKGDKICQFRGTDVACVLRKRSREDQYDIVGRAVLFKSAAEDGLVGGGVSDYSIPDRGNVVTWREEDVVRCVVDIVTFYLLTR